MHWIECLHQYTFLCAHFALPITNNCIPVNFDTLENISRSVQWAWSRQEVQSCATTRFMTLLRGTLDWKAAGKKAERIEKIPDLCLLYPQQHCLEKKSTISWNHGIDSLVKHWVLHSQTWVVSLRQVGLEQFEKTIPSLSQICKGLLLSQRHQQKAKRKLQKMDLKEVENLYIQNLHKAMKLTLSLRCNDTALDYQQFNTVGCNPHWVWKRKRGKGKQNNPSSQRAFRL